MPRVAGLPDLSVDAMPLTAPEPLPALRPDVEPVEAGLDARQLPLRQRRGRLRVDLPTAAPEGAGVGVLDARSGAVLAWRAASAGTPPTALDVDGLPIGDHLVVLALAPEFARWSYLARVRGEVDPTTAPARVTLPTATQSVTLRLRDERGQPLRKAVVTLRRTDDAQWVWRLPEAEEPRGDGFTAADLALTDTQGMVVFAPLGIGRYHVHVEGLQIVDREPNAVDGEASDAADANASDGAAGAGTSVVVPGPAQISLTLRPR